MTRICLALMGLALICACKGKAASEEPIAAQAARVQRDPVEWALTQPMVDGYVRYQRTLLVQAGKLAPAAWDGGLKKFEETSVEQKANLDERARLEAGLTADDVLTIESMLSRLAARRLTFQLMRLNEKLPDLPQSDPFDPRQGAELAAAVQAHAKLKQSIEDLSDERQTFGSANIDVLLTREAELLRNWSLMMEVPELKERR